MEIEKSLSVGEFPLKEVTVWVRRARRARRAARPPPPLAQLRLHSAVGGARRKGSAPGIRMGPLGSMVVLLAPWVVP